MSIKKTKTVQTIVLVILQVNCSRSGQTTTTEHDPFNQAAYGPVAANSRDPIKLPPFPEPNFERVIEQFMVDVANKIGDPEMRKRKKKVIHNPDLLWKPGYIVPESAYANPDLIGVDPFKDKIKILPHDQKGQPISEQVVSYPGIKDRTELPFTGKILYTTKDQEMRVSKFENEWRLPIFTDDYYRDKYEIMLEGIDPLIAAKYLSQFINEHRIKDATLKNLALNMLSVQCKSIHILLRQCVYGRVVILKDNNCGHINSCLKSFQTLLSHTSKLQHIILNKTI